MKKRRGLLLIMLTAMMILVSAALVSADGSVRQVTAAKNRIKVAWSDPSKDNPNWKVNYYKVMWGDSFSSLTKSAKVASSTRNYIIDGLSSNTTYCVRVYYNYYSTVSKKNYESWYSTMIQTLPGKVSGIQYNFLSDQRGFYIRWNKPSGNGTGLKYQYQIRDLSGNRMRNIKTSYTYNQSSKFLLRRVARAYVRAYVQLCGKTYYGPWTVKPVVPQPILREDKTKCFIKDGHLTLSWASVKGAQSYLVYVSKSKNDGYKLVKTVSGSATGTTVNYFNGAAYANNTTYYVKVITKSSIGNSAKTYGIWVRRSVI